MLPLLAEAAGAQGRIRTSVARKERQIYSLLPLTTRPPVHALILIARSLIARSAARCVVHPDKGSFGTRGESNSTLSKNRFQSATRPPDAIHGTVGDRLGAPQKLRRHSPADPYGLRSDHLQKRQRASPALFAERKAPVGESSSLRSPIWKQLWSWRRDLNPRPSDYKSDALPAELRQRNVGTAAAAFETHAKLLASRQSSKVSTSRADAQPVNLTRDKQSYDTSAMIQLRLRFYLNCRPLGYGGSGVLLRLRRDGRLRLPRACGNFWAKDE